MPILLSRDEQEFLLDLLRLTRNDLREEIYKTEAHEFRDELKRKQKILESLLQKVEFEKPAQAAA